MSLWAMSFTSLSMYAVFDKVMIVGRVGIPAEIDQRIIQTVAVVVTARQTIWTRADKCFKDQDMDMRFSVSVWRFESNNWVTAAV